MRLTGAQGKALHWKAMLPTGTTDPCFLDIVGDVHGCLDELLELMAALGYRVERLADDYAVVPPPGRKLAFVGDLVNRGPATAEVLRLAMSMAAAGQLASRMPMPPRMKKSALSIAIPISKGLPDRNEAARPKTATIVQTHIPCWPR